MNVIVQKTPVITKLYICYTQSVNLPTSWNWQIDYSFHEMDKLTTHFMKWTRKHLPISWNGQLLWMKNKFSFTALNMAFFPTSFFYVIMQMPSFPSPVDPSANIIKSFTDRGWTSTPLLILVVKSFSAHLSQKANRWNLGTEV